MQITRAFVVSVLVSTFGLGLMSYAGDYAECDLNMSFSHQGSDVQQKVLNGETVVLSGSDPASPYELTYVLKRVKGDPQLVAGLFTSANELPAHIPAITQAQVLRQTGSSVVIRYELDVSRLAASGVDLGSLASKSPVSRYAVTTHLQKTDAGGYLVTWELEENETAKLNPKKGLFNTGNMGEPGYVHGYFAADPVPGSTDSVVTYANYVVPKSGMAKVMAGTINSSSRAVLSAIVDSIGKWSQTAVANGEAAKGYRDHCEILLTAR